MAEDSLTREKEIWFLKKQVQKLEIAQVTKKPTFKEAVSGALV